MIVTLSQVSHFVILGGGNWNFFINFLSVWHDRQCICTRATCIILSTLVLNYTRSLSICQKIVRHCCTHTLTKLTAYICTWGERVHSQERSLANQNYVHLLNCVYARYTGFKHEVQKICERGCSYFFYFVLFAFDLFVCLLIFLGDEVVSLSQTFKS